MASSYRLCRCGFRYERRKKKCPSCGKPAPRKRVPKHARTLQVHDYDYYKAVSKVLHGIDDESCNVCRKPRGERKLDRDHDHVTGNPRGLVCPLDNMLMKYTQLTPERAQLIADYLKRAKAYEREVVRRSIEKQDTKPEDHGRQEGLST